MTNKEITEIGCLIDVQEKEKVTVLSILVGQKQIEIGVFNSMLQDLPLPKFEMNEYYKFTYHDFNAFHNLSCIWRGQVRVGWKIEKAGTHEQGTTLKIVGAGGSAKSALSSSDKDIRITRLSCISSASDIAAALIAAKKLALKDTKSFVLELAGEFFKWAVEAEP